MGGGNIIKKIIMWDFMAWTNSFYEYNIFDNDLIRNVEIEKTEVVTLPQNFKTGEDRRTIDTWAQGKLELLFIRGGNDLE